MPLPDVAPFAANVLRSAGRNAAEFFFPTLCIACNGPCSPGNPWLCKGCVVRLARNHDNRDACPLCAQDRRFAACACGYAWDFPFERIYSLFDFDDTVKEITHAFKYGNLKSLALYVGKTYAHLVPNDFWEGMDIAVPVPLHFLRALKRGYNQAERLANGITCSGATNIALCGNALQRRRSTRTQTALSKELRLRNLAGAFCVRRPDLVRGRGVVLVDDIVTTGATTSGCARALLDAGARAVRVLSMARD